MHQRDRRFIGKFALLALIALPLINACNQSKPKEDLADTKSTAPAAADFAKNDAEAASQAAAILDENGLNEEGLIVLQGEEAVPGEEAEVSETNVGREDVASTTATTPPKSGNEVSPPVAASLASTPASELKRREQGNVATAEERSQRIAEGWPQPQAVLFVSGQQHGYIEPCGCTGLENQKGGLIRRDTLLTELRQRGWNLIPVDVGNQVRRIGRQAELKFQSTVDAFKLMGYRAATLGIDDLKLSSIELIQIAGSDGLSDSPFLSANVSVVDSSFFPSHRIIEAGGRKIGITAVLGNEFKGQIQSSDIELFDATEKLRPVMEILKKEGCDFRVLLAHASLEESEEIARQVPGFDLVVTAGGYGEPTLNPEPITGSKSVMVQVGTKGMYGGIVGIFDDAVNPIRYQKIAISSQFKDSQRLLEEFGLYQQRLEQAGFAGLGISPIAHPTGRSFVGSEVCGDCHSTAFEKWEETPHFHATTSIIEPDNERGGIARHHDPECISCHVSGWNPQNYYPYASGFLVPEETPHLVGSGCENCHGPGSDHVAAELGDVDVTNERLLELQQQMVLPLARARETCLECHDLDNSPDFHAEGAFEEYWEQVKHYGKD